MAQSSLWLPGGALRKAGVMAIAIIYISVSARDPRDPRVSILAALNGPRCAKLAAHLLP